MTFDIGGRPLGEFLRGILNKNESPAQPAPLIAPTDITDGEIYFYAADNEKGQGMTFSGRVGGERVAWDDVDGDGHVTSGDWFNDEYVERDPSQANQSDIFSYTEETVNAVWNSIQALPTSKQSLTFYCEITPDKNIGFNKDIKQYVDAEIDGEIQIGHADLNSPKKPGELGFIPYYTKSPNRPSLIITAEPGRQKLSTPSKPFTPRWRVITTTFA